MESSPKSTPVFSDFIEGGKLNFTKSFVLSMKKASQLRNNVARNVRGLTGNADSTKATFRAAVNQSPQTMAEASATESAAEVSGRANSSALKLGTWSEGSAMDEQSWKTSSTPRISPSYSNSLSMSVPSLDEEIPSPHFDLSHVRATSAFDIGSIGTPVHRGPESNEIGKLDMENNAWKSDPFPVVIVSSRPETISPQYNQQSPLVELDEVRKFVGNVIIIWKEVRALGLPESSWEKNKMPWRHPRPRYLARGLHWSPEEFPSEKKKHECYRRARRRGPYLFEQIPTCSFIVADLALLYFLIDNPAGKFLL